jgi:hypothetical protein
VNLTTRIRLLPEVKNIWSCTSIPHYAFVVWRIIKRRDVFKNSVANKIMRIAFAKYALRPPIRVFFPLVFSAEFYCVILRAYGWCIQKCND